MVRSSMSGEYWQAAHSKLARQQRERSVPDFIPAKPQTPAKGYTQTWLCQSRLQAVGGNFWEPPPGAVPIKRFKH